MKMKDLAHACISQLSLLELKILSFACSAHHHYVTQPKPVERFVYILKGKACFYVENQKLYAQENHMVYLPGETAYNSVWLEDSEFMVVDMLLHNAEGQPIRFRETPGMLFQDTFGIYQGLLKELAEKSDSNRPFDWLERLSLTFKLLCEMAREANRSELDAQNRKIQAGLAYLQNNFTEDFPIERLAQICCLSVVHFRRIFWECIGTTPVEYRNKLRIKKAVELLKTGTYSVGEVAEAVGIPDINYFSKLFKNYMGISPSAMKK